MGGQEGARYRLTCLSVGWPYPSTQPTRRRRGGAGVEEDGVADPCRNQEEAIPATRNNEASTFAGSQPFNQ